MGFFCSFEKVRDRICWRLINGKGNEELLEDLPHTEFLDLAVCFYYAYQGDALGEGTILIHNSHMAMWNTSTEELVRLARDNTPRLFPWTCNSMGEILKELMPGGWDPDLPWEISMKVLSNTKRNHGAACILYPGVLERMAEEGQSGFYILPSSIHEVILLKVSGSEAEVDLKRMIAEINSTEVAPEEVLSDSLYYYDAVKREIVVI